MNPRITIERRNGKSVRAITYRINGLAAVHLTQRMASAEDSEPKEPTISWLSATSTSDLAYSEAFQECLALACTLSAVWAAERPVTSKPTLFSQPEALSDQMGGNTLQCSVFEHTVRDGRANTD